MKGSGDGIPIFVCPDVPGELGNGVPGNFLEVPAQKSLFFPCPTQKGELDEYGADPLCPLAPRTAWFQGEHLRCREECFNVSERLNGGEIEHGNHGGRVFP